MVQTYLYKEQGFQLPVTSLSGVPGHTRVDHPGVWENAKHAYMHETLISKRGIAAVLAVLQADVLQRLMKLGALEFAVRTDCSDFTAYDCVLTPPLMYLTPLLAHIIYSIRFCVALTGSVDMDRLQTLSACPGAVGPARSLYAMYTSACHPSRRDKVP